MLLHMTHAAVHIYFCSCDTETLEKMYSALCLGLSQLWKTPFYSLYVLSLLSEEFHHVTMFNGK